VRARNESGLRVFKPQRVQVLSHAVAAVGDLKAYVARQAERAGKAAFNLAPSAALKVALACWPTSQGTEEGERR
jgi:hypothetical protein